MEPRRCAGEFPTATVQQAARQMKALELGVVTDRDIAIYPAASGHDPTTTPVEAVMSSQVVWCFDDASVEGALQLMSAEQVRRLPVVDRGRRLVGVLSFGDLVVKAPEASLEVATAEGMPWAVV